MFMAHPLYFFLLTKVNKYSAAAFLSSSFPKKGGM
jgi:hypothetical protein